MEVTNWMKIHTLVTRELQEFRTSLLITPVVIGAGLLLLMLIGVLFAGRLAMMGDGVMHVLGGEGGGSVNFEITIDEDEEGQQELMVDRVEDVDRALPAQELTVSEAPEGVTDEAWNFSREWTFSAPKREQGHSHFEEDDSINPLVNGIHNLFLLVMFFVTLYYLVSCLFDDRKDKSILFWKSLPVSEWQEVLSKLAVATVAAPLVYLAVSIVTQILQVFLAMLLVWRMDGSATEMVLSRVEFVPLFMNQVGGMLVWVLWSLPVYAWFMLASAASKRSPFLMGIAIPIGIVIAEELLFGTEYFLYAASNHLPHLVDSSDAASMGIYRVGPVWGELDFMGMALGAGLAAIFLTGAVWLRKHRFET
jgi:hypothetical protein